jgi:multiple sugar transport system ATP-binding protein
MTEPGTITAPSAGGVAMPEAGNGRPAAVGLDSVAKRFATQVALHPIDLTVSEGEFVTLLGPSGCGKTTLLRIVAGLETPDDGTVTIFGSDVTDRPANKRPVNLVFQRVTLFPHLTVAENVGFGPRLRRMAKAQAREKVQAALDLVRLPDFGQRHVTELSGGQAQRVALARALANDPKVLLLDEPLSALDLEIRRQLQAELKDIHRRLGLTFIYVTHDQEEAMTLGDRVVVMKDGVIQQCGPPLEVYHQPANRFVAGFVGMPPMNFFDGTIVAENGQLWFDEGTGRISVPDWAKSALRGRAGRRVAMGVRPQAISDVPYRGKSGEGSVLTMRVGVVEFLGDKMDIYASTASHPHVIAHIDAHGGIVANETRPMYLDPNRLQFFEADAAGATLASAPIASSGV